ncbi:MAG: LacI family DNA-binding transcriptional regulator [Candidatus Omnitrophota bacterium]
MKKKNITVYEIAKKAGVSIATISRAVNPETRSKVAPETLQKIEALIAELGYTPSFAASHLVKKSTKTIGILFPHHSGIFLSEYYSNILSGVSDHVLGSDYRVKMLLPKPEERFWDAYDFKKGEGIDGIIVTYWRTIFKSPAVFDKLGIPAVIINNIEDGIRARFVAGDHEEGGKMAAAHLYEKGHRKIVVVGGKRGAPDAKARLRGFEAYLGSKQVVLKESDIVDVDFDETEAYKKTETVIGKGADLTAIFCMNDAQAKGVLRKLQELSIDCPGKISLMGYDDDRWTEHSVPPLTTIRVPVYDLAKRAAKDMIDHLSGRMPAQDFYSVIKMPVQLIERGSVKKL